MLWIPVDDYLVPYNVYGDMSSTSRRLESPDPLLCVCFLLVNETLLPGPECAVVCRGARVTGTDCTGPLECVGSPWRSILYTGLSTGRQAHTMATPTSAVDQVAAPT